MSVVVSDLVARVRASGVEETKAAIQGVGASAEQTSRAFELMAAQFAKAYGGTATDALTMFQRTGVQPTAAALAAVADAAEKASTAIDRTAATAKASAASIAAALSGAGVNAPAGRVQSILAAQERSDQQSGLAKALEAAGVSAGVARQQAKSVTDEIRAATKATEDQANHTREVAKATKDVEQGFKLSESSAVRFGAGILGIGLGLNLAAGAASLIHGAIVSVVGAQVDWERSLMRTKALYGDLAPNVVAVAQAQSNAPGLLGSQQEFLSARLSAAYLGSRFGVDQGSIIGLTSGAGAVSRAYGFDATQRRDLQARALAFAEGGGTSLRDITGTEGDPLSISRRIGGVSEAQLGALTPQQIKAVQTQIASVDLYQTALSGQNNQGGLVRAMAEREQVLARAQSALQNNLEGSGRGFVEGPAVSQRSLTRSILEYGEQPARPNVGPGDVGLLQAVNAAKEAFEAAAKTVKDNQAALEEETAKLNKLGVEVGSATFHLIGFAGTLEDRYSIARGDVSAQAQGAVAARARMAIPAIGVTQGEIVASAQNTAYQNAWQNYVAEQAQQEQRNAIREELERRVQLGPAAQRPAAARALEQAQASEPIHQRIGEATRAGALVDMATAETQAKLEQISLTQRERYVQLMRETVDLRKLDVQQQQAGLQATMNVIRAQQAGLPAQYALSDAQFTTSRASVLAQARMARVLQGKDVSGFPSIDSLIQMNVAGQFATAEAGPAALDAQRRVELQQRTATAIGLGQQLTEGQIRYQELGNDLKNLGDLPQQTALELDLVQNNRDQLAVQKELRDLTKDLVRIITGRGASMTSGQGIDEIANRVGALIFGDGSSDIALPAPSDQPGARRGPF